MLGFGIFFIIIIIICLLATASSYTDQISQLAAKSGLVLQDLRSSNIYIYIYILRHLQLCVHEH
jgi:hypothetical protein